MTHFDQTVSRYGTYSTQWDYVQDRFGEKDLLPFSISDMDFQIPTGTQAVLAQAVQRGLFGYTRWNHHDFKGAISGWFQRRFQTTIPEEWISFSPSVMYSLSVMLQLLSKKQGKVVTLMPCYDAFFQVLAQNEQQLLPVTLKAEDHFAIDFPELERLFQVEQPNVFLLCSPHNPTGRVFSKKELQQLIQLCNTYQVALISDEIHMDVLRQGVQHTPLLALQAEIQVPVVLMSSASKTFNSPGLGCSYIVTSDAALTERFLAILKGRDGLSSVPYLGMLALMDCYNEQEAWVNELNHYIDENFKIMQAMLKDSAIQTYLPDATYLAWLDVSQVNMTMDELQHQLVHQEKVAIMRGDTYGPQGKNYLRLNLGAPKEKIIDGIERLLRVIEQ